MHADRQTAGATTNKHSPRISGAGSWHRAAVIQRLCPPRRQKRRRPGRWAGSVKLLCNSRSRLWCTTPFSRRHLRTTRHATTQFVLGIFIPYPIHLLDPSIRSAGAQWTHDLEHRSKAIVEVYEIQFSQIKRRPPANKCELFWWPENYSTKHNCSSVWWVRSSLYPGSSGPQRWLKTSIRITFVLLWLKS